MKAAAVSTARVSPRALHWLGVSCGFGAGAWLGAAEAPTKLVTAGFSPFIISLGMVAGVFVARWTVPSVLKGTAYIWLDIKEKKHLLVWAILAGMLWAVANTLTVFAIRNVGLSIAFPLWNTNSLVGLFWGWLLFNELRNAGAGQWAKVLGGAAAIVTGACLLAYATSHHTGVQAEGAAAMGIAAALGAGLLWGTMYIPYRKAYLSGMNPLSFVTVFTFGELGTVFALALAFGGGYHKVMADLSAARPVMFWLFLGGFCWVLGDLFQQYAAKYIGIGRGIPLSNTNQLWGLAWGALVFGELTGQSGVAKTLVIAGSLVMMAGAAAISFAEAPQSEQRARRAAMERECRRYGMQLARLEASIEGEDVLAREKPRRHWGRIPPGPGCDSSLRLAGFRGRARAHRRRSPMDGGALRSHPGPAGGLRPAALAPHSLLLIPSRRRTVRFSALAARRRAQATIQLDASERSIYIRLSRESEMEIPDQTE